MPVIIGSARHNEKGSLKGGKAGDQTGGEVSTQAFYEHKKGWVILRLKNIAQSEQLAKAMQQACSNNHIGYCQDHRGGAINLLPKYGSLGAININTETDCSDLVRACIMQATGIKLKDFTTYDEVEVLLGSGMFDRITYSSGTTLYTGDVLVTKTKGHTAIVTSGKSRSAVIASKPVSTITTKPAPSQAKPVLKLGSKGEAVKEWQKIVGVVADGDFGHNTENATKIWQKNHGLAADGVVGPKSWAAVGSASVVTPTAVPSFQKYNVKVLTALNVRATPGGKVVTVIRDNGIYGIIAEQNGWGKLQSGAGWIALKYTQRI